ncbi:bleomycin hydrolase-like [Montipora foliosa]|uniref:bleomycin hydrolase-like n=1 Tax=Montipora foliosa TaxID=591990 RepID=UPI0035F1C7A0
MADAGIEKGLLAEMKTSFESDVKNLMVQNVVTQYDPLEVCLDRNVAESVNHVYKHKVKEVKPVTNQRASGRCWIFAFLNAIRQKFVQHFNLEDFEFSQQYLYFWDRIERAYFFIDVYEKLARKGEDPDGRLMMFLLSNPLNDGGQWDMLINLVEKYGLVPKEVWPEAFTAGRSMRLRKIMNYKLREYAVKLKELVDKKNSEAEIKEAKAKMMNEVYRITSICLGSPPQSFDWEYFDKSKAYCKLSAVTPLQFYNQHVKPVYNPLDKVCLVNDPRNPYNKLLTVEYLSNMVNGRQVLYNNQSVDVLKKLSAASLRDNEAVWFGCDVGKHFERKIGALHLNIHNYELAFGISMLNLDKAQRLLYGDSLMTHAMVFTGVSWEGNMDSKQEGDKDSLELKTTKWRVENSWGEEKDKPGYLMMTDEWFTEFVYEVVVDKKYVPADVMAVLEEEPIVLPAWDPMGSLACASCNQGDHQCHL